MIYLIEDVVVSEEVLRRKFVCNLEKCKGACCWEGDHGAPVHENEIEVMQAELENIIALLSPASKSKIESKGVASYDSEYQGVVTPLLPDGACVYMVRDAENIAYCAWEKSYREGRTAFYKPLSCHLYPLRIHKNEKTGWEALNYDDWEICSAACQLGEELKTPVFKFVKEAIIRAYGADFYQQLEGLLKYEDSKE